MNWKKVAKYFRSQFLLWLKMYNEVADIYMIDESFSVAAPNVTVTKTWRNGQVEA